MASNPVPQDSEEADTDLKHRRLQFSKARISWLGIFTIMSIIWWILVLGRSDAVPESVCRLAPVSAGGYLRRSSSRWSFSFFPEGESRSRPPFLISSHVTRDYCVMILRYNDIFWIRDGTFNPNIQSIITQQMNSVFSRHMRVLTTRLHIPRFIGNGLRSYLRGKLGSSYLNIRTDNIFRIKFWYWLTLLCASTELLRRRGD
jgi:hypothetical protein